MSARDVFDGLNGPYATIVCDPPWAYDEGFGPQGRDRTYVEHVRTPLPYSSMTLAEITALPVADIAAPDSHLYLWTTNRYLRHSYGVVEAWGFKPSTTLIWCKPKKGIGPGGAYALTAEFVLFARRGSLPCLQRCERNWWEWPRGRHSVKPAGFMDVVESVSPGPYVELFAREPRLGWDSWGYGYETKAS